MSIKTIEERMRKAALDNSGSIMNHEPTTTFWLSQFQSYKKELRDGINKIHDKKQNQLHGGYDDADYLNAYCQAINDVLTLLDE